MVRQAKKTESENGSIYADVLIMKDQSGVDRAVNIDMQGRILVDDYKKCSYDECRTPIGPHLYTMEQNDPIIGGEMIHQPS